MDIEMEVNGKTRVCGLIGNPVEHTHAHFAAMISRLDIYVGEVLAMLKEKGLDENTLVIFASDNGPHEEGGADPDFFGRDGKLRGIKCGVKSTSCPDQLACALQEILDN